MNKNQTLHELQEINKNYRFDKEEAHTKADDALCAFLSYLGYNEIVDEFEKIPKWYS